MIEPRHPARTAVDAPRPDVRDGDHWRFAVLNRLSGARNEETRRVLRVTHDRIHCDLRSTDAAFAGGHFVYTRHWNLVSRPAQAHAGDTPEDAGRWTWRPPYPQFRFPLRPGKRWQGVARVSNAATDTTNEHRYLAEVLAPQSLVTAAGTLDVLPVRYEARVSTEGADDATLVWRNLDLLHYAPALRLFVRAEYRVTAPDGSAARDSLYELIDHGRSSAPA
jgi:hypothetical protein